MFDSLRKRLKQAVDKVSKTISGEKETTEELRELKRDESLLQASREDLGNVVHKQDIIEDDTKSMEKKEGEPEEEKETVSEEEAKIISEQEPFKEIAGDEEKEKIEEKVEELIEEETGEDRKIAEEEAKLIVEEEPFSEIVEEETEIEEKQEVEEKIEELVEETLNEDVKEELPADEKRKLSEIERMIEDAPVLEEIEIGRKKPSILKRITEKRLDELEVNEILRELEIALLENDVSVEVTESISKELKAKLIGASVKRGRVEDTIKEALRSAIVDVMKQERINLEHLIAKKDGTFTIMMIGFNGTGKTTTLAKLAYRLKKYKPILAAADTFRAASIEQLEEHGRRLDMRVIKHTYGADAAAVIFDAKKHAGAVGSKLVLADTAGRAHSNTNLMDELKKVVRVNAPDFKILVLDSITGNDIYDQCKLFNEAVGVDAIILTKADVYERGGAALSAAYTLKKPILFLGVGQEYEDLKEFNPEEIVENLLD
jgi:fused signal recognition particle receptor